MLGRRFASYFLMRPISPLLTPLPRPDYSVRARQLVFAINVPSQQRTWSQSGCILAAGKDCRPFRFGRDASTSILRRVWHQSESSLASKEATDMPCISSSTKTLGPAGNQSHTPAEPRLLSLLCGQREGHEAGHMQGQRRETTEGAR